MLHKGGGLLPAVAIWGVKTQHEAFGWDWRAGELWPSVRGLAGPHKMWVAVDDARVDRKPALLDEVCLLLGGKDVETDAVLERGDAAAEQQVGELVRAAGKVDEAVGGLDEVLEVEVYPGEAQIVGEVPVGGGVRR